MKISSLIPFSANSLIPSFSIPELNPETINKHFTEIKIKKAALKALEAASIVLGLTNLRDGCKHADARYLNSYVQIPIGIAFIIALNGSYSYYASKLKDFNDLEELPKLREEALTTSLPDLEESYSFYGGLPCLIDKNILSQSELRLKLEEELKKTKSVQDLCILLQPNLLEKYSQLGIFSKSFFEKEFSQLKESLYATKN